MGVIKETVIKACEELLDLYNIEYEKGEEIDTLREKINSIEKNTNYYFSCGIVADNIFQNAINKNKDEQSSIAISLDEFLSITGVKNNGWKTKTRPTSDLLYLVTLENKDGARTTSHELFHTSDNKWDCERDDLSEWKVVAWKDKEQPFDK